MRRAWIVMLWAVALLAGLAGPAGATEPDRCTGADNNAERILRQTLHRPKPPERPAADQAAPAQATQPEIQPTAPSRRTAPAQLVASRHEGSRISGDSIRIAIRLPDTHTTGWTQIRLHGVARTVDQVTPLEPDAPGALNSRVDTLCRYRFRGVYARLISETGRDAVIEVDYPKRDEKAPRDFAMSRDWAIVVGLEAAADHVDGAEEPRLFAFGVVPTHIGSRGWAVVTGLAVVIIAYGLLATVSFQINRRRLERAAARAFAAEAEPPSWRRRYALDPVFVTQDASGIGSLARLQLLVFTLAIAYVSTYVLIRTGQIAALSTDVLWLLGIAVAGSSLARVTGDTGSVSGPNRIWIKGKRLVISDEARLPRYADLVCADGEVEIARVQAIIFSALTVIALLLRGPSDLGGFEISDEMLLLLGLSQATFVVGKAVPGETIRRLNQEINAARAAEKQMQGIAGRRAALAPDATADLARATEDAAAARAAWEAALTAAEDTLLDVYGEMLDTDRLAALRTGAA